MTSLDSERKAFEAWATTRRNQHNLPFFTLKKDDGSYVDGTANYAWEGWKARALNLIKDTPK